MKRIAIRLSPLLILLSLLIVNVDLLYASGNRTFECATSEDVYKALNAVKPGDTIVLQGGNVYEIDKSFELKTHGLDNNRITLTSKDSTGQGRYAVISTVRQKKEESLVAPPEFINNIDFIISQAVSNSLALKNTQVIFTQVNVIKAKNIPFHAEILNGIYLFCNFSNTK